MPYIKHIRAAGTSWWMHSFVSVFNVLFYSLCDGVNIFTVFDLMLYESPMLLTMMTLGCAVSLNLIPVISSRTMHNYRYYRSRKDGFVLAILTIAWLILFGATFYLRWTTRELAFSGGDRLITSLSGLTGLSATDPDSKEAIAIILILGISPGITSAVTFAMEHLMNDPVRDKFFKSKELSAMMTVDLAQKKAARYALSQDWKPFYEETDKRRKEAAAASIRAAEAAVKTRARDELIKKIGSEDACLYINDPAKEV